MVVQCVYGVCEDNMEDPSRPGRKEVRRCRDKELDADGEGGAGVATFSRGVYSVSEVAQAVSGRQKGGV